MEFDYFKKEAGSAEHFDDRWAEELSGYDERNELHRLFGTLLSKEHRNDNLILAYGGAYGR